MLQSIGSQRVEHDSDQTELIRTTYWKIPSGRNEVLHFLKNPSYEISSNLNLFK